MLANAHRHTRLAWVISWGLIAGLPLTAQASDWLRFRGPNGSGVCPDPQPTPVSWSDSTNLKWKLKLPGPGSSSPIVVGNRVLLTCWTGYGTDAQDPGDQQNLKRHLICVDRTTGQITWSQAIDAVLPEDTYRGMFTENGYATHTPVSDGERVYAFFGKTGVVAFDLEGSKLWQTSVGTGLDPQRWGSASSPILYKKTVIVTAAAESRAVVALDKQTGEEIWRQEAEGFGGTWSTPVLVQVSQDRTDLVVAVPYEIWGLNPETGKLRWYCEAISSNSMSASPVVHDGVVYVLGGRNGGSVAVRAGGQGDVTKTHVLWSGRDRARISSPIYHEGRLYWIRSGIANCLDAENGQRVYQQRLSRSSGNQSRTARNRGPGRFFGRGGQDYSSPVASQGKLYYVTRGGETFVIRLGEKFQQLAKNRFDDPGEFSATPAISQGELFLRSTQFLYCIAETSDPSVTK